MNRGLIVVGVLAALFAMTVVSEAALTGPATGPVENGGVPGGELDIVDAINRLANPSTPYTDNNDVQSLRIDDFGVAVTDQLWSDGSGDIVAIGLNAGNYNRFGVYKDTGAVGDTSTGAIRTELFAGQGTNLWTGDNTYNNPYTAATADMDVLDNDNLFGFYLQSNTGGPYYLSQQDANLGGRDHMLTYDLTSLIGGQSLWVDRGDGPTQIRFVNPHLIAWEDLDLGDADYNDMMLIIDLWHPTDDEEAAVPEPATLAIWSIFGAGAAGVAAARRRRRGRWSHSDRRAIYGAIKQS